jgi:16S rRNA C967 or C1407 C5-methylase (RsmB/RsmF family)/NOL1/NOP2/fmu family ribosome biogenesis protein
MSEIKLPETFVTRMKKYLGEKEYTEFAESLEKEPRVSIRINPFKQVDLKMDMTAVAWNNEGYFLPERPSFTLDPLFHAGCYYVQESSSMFIGHILNFIEAPKNGIFLDLAAAPGGKSTLLSSYLGEEGFLVANEVIKTRANILKENIIKWGLGNTMVTQNDPEHFRELEGFFDLVLVDAPCSGEGLFRKDQEARNEWSEDNVNLCALRQERILDQAGALVKGGGHLIYSTCTFNEKENEDMVRFICSEYAYEPVRIPLDPKWGIRESKIETEDDTFFGYRFYPHLVKGEGLFVSVFKRPEDAYVQEPKKIKDFKHSHIKAANRPESQKLISDLGLEIESRFYNLQESFFWTNTTHQTHFEFLCRFLNIRYFGVELGKFNKDQFIPNHEFAVSILPKKGFTKYELNLDQALTFLRKEDMEVSDIPEGWVLVSYQNIPLGWIKNLGNRINNNYPKEWRIRIK